MPMLAKALAHGANFHTAAWRCGWERSQRNIQSEVKDWFSQLLVDRGPGDGLGESVGGVMLF